MNRSERQCDKYYCVGYMPTSFPRDPVHVNQLPEHMFLGQILEPLVDSDRNGQIKCGLSTSWVFEDGGKRIIFDLGVRKFSDGKVVTADDVAYSISRHLGTNSQSAVFLADVHKVYGNENGQVVVELKQQNVAIIQALTRDQLGVLPSGWQFDPQASEPFIGTGPYRMIKRKGEWLLIENIHYPNKKSVAIKGWRLLYQETELKDGDIPDYVPLITQGALGEIKKHVQFDSAKYLVREVPAFSQTSFWIHPTSDLFEQTDDRAIMAVIFSELVERFAERSDFPRAKGLIPLGVLGHNATGSILENSSQKIADRKLTVAYMKGTFTPFVESDLFRDFVARNNFELQLVPWDATTLSDLKGRNIDIITGSWAGGYSDPTGFLGLLPMVLGTDLNAYLGESLSTKLRSAKDETDWKSRAVKFQEFDKALTESGLLIPGWRTLTYSVLRKPLAYKEIQSGYTERFVNITDNVIPSI